ncbi:hypothetical protein ACFFWD_08025 [Bradyrhizobium erythrophlei]|uniref:hypothetical protein n=1 Tax=Bradyrhizobium erythrophlei TaxID=1437360 RepID=UPI0035E7AA13
MGGLNGDAFSGFRLNPAAEDAAAREDQPVNGVALDHSDLQVAIKGRRFDHFPSEVVVDFGTLFMVAD